MRSHLPLLSLAAVSALFVAVACGGNAAQPVTPTGPTDSASAGSSSTPSATVSDSASAAPLPTVWSATMSEEQQAAFMKANIVPKMGPLFKEHDAKKYGEFSCKTCHGPDYKEPKAFLPHLTLKNGAITQIKDKPEISKWMMDVVSPQMASAMGLPHYDPKTQQGFGCNGCHTIDMK
ncbi:hypothetical protein BH09MYX1_BH09MYX1_45760 [soil metagenome]